MPSREMADLVYNLRLPKELDKRVKFYFCACGWGASREQIREDVRAWALKGA
jgi:hypothetical protein